MAISYIFLGTCSWKKERFTVCEIKSLGHYLKFLGTIRISKDRSFLRISYYCHNNVLAHIPCFREHFKMNFLKLSQFLDITQVPFESHDTRIKRK